MKDEGLSQTSLGKFHIRLGSFIETFPLIPLNKLEGNIILNI